MAARPSLMRAKAAMTGRPRGSLTSTVRSSPPSAPRRTSMVPSPPSATGNSSASRPASRRPEAIAAATSGAEKVPLKESGATRAGCSANRFAERPLRLRAVHGEDDPLEPPGVRARRAGHQARRLVERKPADAGPERHQRQRAAAELLGLRERGEGRPLD